MCVSGLAAVLLCTAGLHATQPRVSPILDPTNLPRLAFEELKYAGAFRLPAGEIDGATFSFSGGPLAFNPERNTLFVGARGSKVAEITIPTPVVSERPDALPFSEIVQPFADPAEGRMPEIDAEAGLAGLLVFEQRLVASGLIYYDANNTQRLSHFSRPLTLATRGAGPMRRVGQGGRTGFVAGYMALVPPEWQSRLGGPAVTGQCCVPIITRTSWGPSAWAFDPADLDKRENLNAIPLVYYDGPALGAFEGSAPAFGATTVIGGVALINGTRTAVFVGSTGTGTFCYGHGTGDKTKANTKGPDGTRYCYDPSSDDKGNHAYPYRFQMWAYDLSDWAMVRAGRKDPEDVRPYGIWPFELPTPEPSTRIIGVALDPARRRLFIAQRFADRDEYSFRALIHVYEL
jgi:hypothetical protein